VTFYNVISGILFMGAFQAFVAAHGTPAMGMAAILVAILCNEAVLTSELLERKESPVPYTLAMKFIDLLTFFVLAYALMVVSPRQNTFGTNLDGILFGANRPAMFCALLTAYWALTLWWNQKAGQNLAAVWRSWFIGARVALIGVFGIAALLYLPYRTFAEISWWPPLILVALTVAYMLAKLSPVTRPSA